MKNEAFSPRGILAVAVMVVALGAGAARAADPELTVMEWAGYDDPNFHQSYIEKYGDSPTYAFYSNEQEAVQKLRAGFRADMLHPCSNTIGALQDAGLLKPIDTSRIAEWDNLMNIFKALPNVERDGKIWFVPADWGNTALLYRTDIIPAEEASTLQIFLDPKYEGRIAINGDVFDAYALAFMATGTTDMRNPTDEQIAKATDFLRALNQNLRFYWTSAAELNQAMASGEVVLAWGWNETESTLQAQDVPVVMNRNTVEGTVSWACGFSMLKDAPGSEQKAYDYVNAFLEERTARYMIQAWGYGHSNEKALDVIGIDILEEHGLGNYKKFTRNAGVQTVESAETREHLTKQFERIKAGF